MAGNIEETYVKEENKVDVDETFINLDCVKKEPIEEYRITLEYENIIGGTSHFKFEENKDNLIGFVDNDVIMENATIKLEDVKDEFSNNFYCNKCSGIYKSFCLTCSTLLCILHNSVSLPNSKLNNMPTDILEIKETSMGKGVFLLRTLPKNVRFGPFEGISGIKTTEGCSWKISGKKLLSVDYGNWMKDVCTANALFRNLDIFQIDDSLYFQTTREIIEGEELLIYYADNELQKLANSEECLYTPRKEEKIPQIFACTLCCLGFGSDECLMEHKRKCPRLDQTRNIKDFELLECHYCKMWLEKKEYDQHHVSYCLDKHQRMGPDYSQAFDRIGTSVGKIENHLDIKEERQYQCNMSSETYGRRGNFQQDANGITRDDQCFYGKTKENNSNVDILAKHTSNEHTQNAIQKKYKRLGSSLQKNHEKNLNDLNTHNDTKSIQCAMCLEKFAHQFQLENHIKNKYGDKNYKCSECCYQINDKPCFENHLNRHRGVKPYQCNICMRKFTLRYSLKIHIKNMHLKNGKKDYKCSDCDYETNSKYLLNGHVLNKHKGIKQFECEHCKTNFTQKGNLNFHIKNQHTQSDHKCSICDYRTKVKGNLKVHLKTHGGGKSFKCGICMREFSKKISWERHIATNHAGSEKPRNDKIYNCSECSYQTDTAHKLTQHVDTHTERKPFHAKIDMYFGF